MVAVWGGVWGKDRSEVRGGGEGGRESEDGNGERKVGVKENARVLAWRREGSGCVWVGVCVCVCVSWVRGASKNRSCQSTNEKNG